MSWFLRAWGSADAGSDRVISQAVYPEYHEDPAHPAWFPARQLGAPAEYSSRYVAVEAASRSRVAYATLWELRPGRYRFDLAVRPECQGQGLGAQLLDRVMDDAKRLRATGLQARVRDDHGKALDFVCRRGFQESHRMGAYRIDFARAHTRSFEEASARLLDRGIEIANLAALRRDDSNYLGQFYDLYSAAREGWPDPDPPPPGTSTVSFEWLRGCLEEIKQPEAFFIARSGRQYVGFTGFFAIGTGVHPEFRRKGIATLLKAASIADALRRGYSGQTSSTASPAMRAVLERLGYQRLWSEIRLIRGME
jgi:GNAT superfamily N-acetyltransferase